MRAPVSEKIYFPFFSRKSELRHNNYFHPLIVLMLLNMATNVAVLHEVMARRTAQQAV